MTDHSAGVGYEDGVSQTRLHNPTHTAAHTDAVQSRVRDFFSTTAFTPYGVREWKRSLSTANPRSHSQLPGDTVGGFVAAERAAGAERAHSASNERYSRRPVTGDSADGQKPSAPLPALSRALLDRPSRPQRPITFVKSPGGQGHYRKIEDLSRFVRGADSDADTYYFKDAMERRLEREAQSVACYGRQEMLSVDQSDPRFCVRLDPEASEARRRAKALSLPPKVTRFHQKFLETTALVRPYALGESHVRHTAANSSDQRLKTNREPLDTFILTMQCQRPTKGVSAPY